MNQKLSNELLHPFIKLCSSVLFVGCLFYSCTKQIKINSTSQNLDSIKLEFDIQQEEVRLSSIRTKFESGKDALAYFSRHEIFATLKSTNISDKTVEVILPHFIVYENFEIKNIQGDDMIDLVDIYDYSVIVDPETYDSIYEKNELKSLESFIDTVSVTQNIKLHLCEPNTYLIRIKTDWSQNIVYSNWDTIVVTK